MDIGKNQGNTPPKPYIEDEYYFDSTKTDPESEEHVGWKDIRPQILACNVGFLFTMHAGINLAFSNLLLNDFDSETSSWCASIVGLSTPFGACLSGALMDKVGRKRVNLFIGIPCILSWALTAVVLSDQRWLLYTARFLSGVAGGMTTANIVYVSEISHKKYRPVMLSLLSVYFSLGILITTVLKLVFSWRQSALCFSIFFWLVLVLVAVNTTETPIWLASFRNDWDGAKKSLRKLYTNPKIFENEWRYLIHSTRSAANPYAPRILKCTNPIVYKPMIYLYFLFLLQQLSGIYLAILYAIKIIPAISPRHGEGLKNEVFVLFGVMRLLTSVSGSLMSVHVGRKYLLLASSVGMLLSCVTVIASVSCSLSTPAEVSAVIAFIAFVSAGSFGVMCIPWTLTFELLPTEVKSKGGTVLISYAYALISVCAKVFPGMLESVDVRLVFGFFGVITFVLIVFVYLCIPETLGKTFREIEQHFELCVDGISRASPARKTALELQTYHDSYVQI